MCLFPLSGIVRGIILYVPFRYLAAYLGAECDNRLLSTLAQPQQVELALKIGRVCRLLERYTPWQSKCLVQATLAKTLLRLYGIPYVLHFGLAKKRAPSASTAPQPLSGLSAHAWVSVGDKVICGARGHRSFTVVGTYVWFAGHGIGSNGNHWP
jgi:hypothetical protein